MDGIQEKQRMTTHFSMIYFAMGVAYFVLTGIFIFLQEILHKSQIDIPERYLLFVALGFSVLGGSVSYNIFRRKSHLPFDIPDFINHLSKSVLASLCAGLFLSGYVSTNWWLGSVLVAAFFKDGFFALVDKVVKSRIGQLLHIAATPEKPKRVRKPPSEKEINNGRTR